ncbi:MAG TPA: nuclear transport factor 2 family protein [Tepidisphaeraceae bacterium]|nr:nuclear transport factor 2 family protein [Tepidisphaeraceae bacterium]
MAAESAHEIGKKLVELCNSGKSMEAMEQLYAKDIVSIEPHGGPEMPAKMQGIDKVRGKGEWWYKNHTIHEFKATGPYPHGDRFIVLFHVDITPKAGPMAGKRVTFQEAGLYMVKSGKVAQEEFFYHMGG